MSPLPGNLEPAASHSSAVAHGIATLTIALPPIEPAGVPYPWASSTPLPIWLAPKTASISGSVGKRRFGPIPLGNGASACATPSPGVPLQCSITVSAPRGSSVSVTMTTYASGSTKPLASGSQRVQIFAGSNFATATILGVAQKVVSRLMPSTLLQGRSSDNPLVAYGVDAAGEVIPGQLANRAALNVRLSGFVNQTINQSCDQNFDCSQLYCCGVVTNFAYNGLETGKETFRTTSTIAYNPTTTKAAVRPGNTQLATLLVGTYAQTGYLNLQFPMGSSGNVSPVRSIGFSTETAEELYGEDTAGDYWAYASHYSNTGSLLGTISVPSTVQPVAADQQGHIYAIPSESCAFSEFPANTYGALAAIRSVTCSAERVSAITFDDAGNVYLALPYTSGAATILEYPPTGSGALAPTRAISIPGTYSTFTAIACDGNGNLYGLLYGGTGPQQLLEFAPGSTTGQQLLTGVPISTFTVDDGGDVFIASQASQTAPVALEEFPAGSSTPSNIITGSNTQLTEGIAQILVPR